MPSWQQDGPLILLLLLLPIVCPSETKEIAVLTKMTLMAVVGGQGNSSNEGGSEEPLRDSISQILEITLKTKNQGRMTGAVIGLSKEGCNKILSQAVLEGQDSVSLTSVVTNTNSSEMLHICIKENSTEWFNTEPPISLSKPPSLPLHFRVENETGIDREQSEKGEKIQSWLSSNSTLF